MSDSSPSCINKLIFPSTITSLKKINPCSRIGFDSSSLNRLFSPHHRSLQNCSPKVPSMVICLQIDSFSLQAMSLYRSLRLSCSRASKFLQVHYRPSKDKDCCRYDTFQVQRRLITKQMEKALVPLTDVELICPQ